MCDGFRVSGGKMKGALGTEAQRVNVLNSPELLRNGGGGKCAVTCGPCLQSPDRQTCTGLLRAFYTQAKL